ncbi:small acid-soluble spore protein [[Clostridium] ultunense Esp]|uniref:small acid-soluble spore protein SspI n=1 Tax=Thermicanus aegyptius TaxID=94009 RepID=UPI0002B705E5|nr:small acid-soluble spore protein SspI [Thermicanus aegyptius]CCQ98352.1 small acid-soluble spore protein [[Clostridium] ultunense Esp]
MAISIKDLDLRQAIIAKLNGVNQESLRETITDAIQSKEEKTLPGLGVLFEILWQNSSDQKQQEMLDIMVENLS